jgi:hypothetical protein
MKKTVSVLVAAGALAAAASAAAPQGEPPAAVVAFARTLPAYFAELENYVASEKTVQQVMREQTAMVFRSRVLESDYEVAHLGEDPSALWEFRFVRSVDGKSVDAERQMNDFFRLRQPSAAAERRSIVDLAREKSLPGYYWHNLTLTLLAFDNATLGDFDWTPKSGQWAFRQARGPGIPEDLFDPASPRHYPSGTIAFDPRGGWLSRLYLEWTSGERRARITMTFSPPAAPGEIALPHRYEAVHARRTSGAVVDRTTFDYSNFRRFTVTTDSETSGPGH